MIECRYCHLIGDDADKALAELARKSEVRDAHLFRFHPCPFITSDRRRIDVRPNLHWRANHIDRLASMAAKNFPIVTDWTLSAVCTAMVNVLHRMQLRGLLQLA